MTQVVLIEYFKKKILKVLEFMRNSFYEVNLYDCCNPNRLCTFGLTSKMSSFPRSKWMIYGSSSNWTKSGQ